jgi:hypothetical protein
MGIGVILSFACGKAGAANAQAAVRTAALNIPRRAEMSLERINIAVLLPLEGLAGSCRKPVSNRQPGRRYPHADGVPSVAVVQCPVREIVPHSSADASRLAALLIGQILPVFSLFAPCDPGASALSMLAPISRTEH